jgi:hypothetical protein
MIFFVKRLLIAFGIIYCNFSIAHCMEGKGLDTVKATSAANCLLSDVLPNATKFTLNDTTKENQIAVGIEYFCVVYDSKGPVYEHRKTGYNFKNIEAANTFLDTLKTNLMQEWTIYDDLMEQIQNIRK